MIATEAKGLTVDVTRSTTMPDCSNGGVSARFDRLTVVGVLLDGDKLVRPLDRTARVFAPTTDRPAVALAAGPAGTVQVVPVAVNADGEFIREPHWTMFGGTYAGFSDSRLHDAVRGIVKHNWHGGVCIHDRIES